MKKTKIYEKYIKRFLDIFLSLVAIIGLAPLLLVIAVLVRKKLGKPVIFTQDRPGLNEKIFKLYKFRSMTDERDKQGELLPDEIRLTSFGKFLRSTSLDELPELFNILKGDMSIVGPRPLLVKYLDRYTPTQKRDIQKRVYLKYPKWAYQIGKNTQYEVLNINKAIDSMVDWCKLDSSNSVKVLKDDDLLNTRDYLDEERKQGRANHLIRIPRWLARFGYGIMRISGKNKYTFLLNKAIKPLRSE